MAKPSRAAAIALADRAGVAVYRSDTVASIMERVTRVQMAQEQRQAEVRPHQRRLSALARAARYTPRRHPQLWLPLALPHRFAGVAGKIA